MKDWNSALQASTVDPFSHPHATKPSRSCPKRKKADWSSPPIIISGQKQLTPWPSFERAATVDNTVLVKSSRKRRALLLNSFFRYWLVIFSPSVISSLFKVTFSISAALNWFNFLHFFNIMYQNLSLNSSTDSDVFYVEQSLAEGSPVRYNTPAILNSTQLSGAIDPESITISSVASPEPQIVTIDSDSNEPTFPYAFGTQHPIVPPSLNDLNLPPNPFNVLATMAVIQQHQAVSPQSPRPSGPSPISTPPMNLSMIEGVGRRHTLLQTIIVSIRLKTSLDGYTGTFLLTRQLNRMNPDESIPLEAHFSHRHLHRDKREDWAWGCLFLKGGNVSAHLRGMRATPSTKKDTLMLRDKLKL